MACRCGAQGESFEEDLERLGVDDVHFCGRIGQVLGDGSLEESSLDLRRRKTHA